MNNLTCGQLCQKYEEALDTIAELQMKIRELVAEGDAKHTLQSSC